jgi:hypothetical protein
MREIDQVTVALDRVVRLGDDAKELARLLPESRGRAQLAVLADRAHGLTQRVARAELELVTLGRSRIWDALIEIRPTGDRRARDLLVETYTEWAEARHFDIEWLHEPLADDEPALLAIKGNYAFGLLEHEAGVHRLRADKSLSVATVRVAVWNDERKQPVIETHRALKQLGQYGGKVRSRIECEGGLALQNDRTLAANRELAAELVASFEAVRAASDEIVRRYDREPFLIRDVATGFQSGRPDALRPELFHELLCTRAAQPREASSRVKEHPVLP